jgi:hypothetical protein
MDLNRGKVRRIWGPEIGLFWEGGFRGVIAGLGGYAHSGGFGVEIGGLICGHELGGIWGVFGEAWFWGCLGRWEKPQGLGEQLDC